MTEASPASDALGPDALDFWIGHWIVTWSGGHGTNTIRRILDGRVIEEVFEAHGDGESLLGRSHSVLDSADGRWRQTWVDSSGGYLDFIGVEVDGRLSFQRSTTVDGSPALQRMLWLEVTPEGFRWEWQRSTDNGTTWSVQWALDYRRSDASPAS